ncbi:DUF6223 family protein [Streptomyces laurentii]|uniref:DUF6223 family protein n=1 Tax=Streptomyces laurentii TaxID=39478 RepID=UPI0033E3A6AF
MLATTTTLTNLAVSTYSLGPGRIGSSVGALIALAGVVLAWRATTRGHARLAIAAGVTGIVLGTVVAVTADGGLGTGNGLGGAYVALLLGLAATVLGGRAHGRTGGISR